MTPSIISVHKLPLDNPKSVRAAHAILGSKPGASRKSIDGKRRRLAAKAHPDHGGDRSRFEAINAAWDLLKKTIKTPARAGRGRPRKHFYSDEHAENGKALRLLKRIMKRVADCDETYKLVEAVVRTIKKGQEGRWRIVDTNAKTKIKRGGKIVTVTMPVPVEGWNSPHGEGFNTEKEAKASFHKLKVLTVKALQAAIDNPSDSTAIALLRDLQRHTPRWEIAGPPGQQRVKKHRAAKEAREKEEARKVQEYIAKQSNHHSDRHGSCGEISGGWDWKQIESVTAAHDAAAGGYSWQIPPARRSRGNGFRCFGTKSLPYAGNGPDSFDRFDESADTADTYLDSRLSPQDPDDGTGTPHVFKSYDQLSLRKRRRPRIALRCPALICRHKSVLENLLRRPGKKLTKTDELEVEQLGVLRRHRGVLRVSGNGWR